MGKWDQAINKTMTKFHRIFVFSISGRKMLCFHSNSLPFFLGTFSSQLINKNRTQHIFHSLKSWTFLGEPSDKMYCNKHTRIYGKNSHLKEPFHILYSLRLCLKFLALFRLLQIFIFLLFSVAPAKRFTEAIKRSFMFFNKNELLLLHGILLCVLCVWLVFGAIWRRVQHKVF